MTKKNKKIERDIKETIIRKKSRIYMTKKERPKTHNEQNKSKKKKKRREKQTNKKKERQARK